MSEKEIRERLREVCEELDRRARKVMFPTLLGAALALGAGCGGDDKPRPDSGAQPAYMAVFREMRAESGPMPAYGVFADLRTDGKKKDLVSPPQPEYAAPQPDH